MLNVGDQARYFQLAVSISALLGGKYQASFSRSTTKKLSMYILQLQNKSQAISHFFFFFFFIRVQVYIIMYQKEHSLVSIIIITRHSMPNKITATITTWRARFEIYVTIKLQSGSIYPRLFFFIFYISFSLHCVCNFFSTSWSHVYIYIYSIHTHSASSGKNNFSKSCDLTCDMSFSRFYKKKKKKKINKRTDK